MSLGNHFVAGEIQCVVTYSYKKIFLINYLLFFQNSMAHDVLFLSKSTLSDSDDAGHEHDGWMTNVRFAFMLCIVVHVLVMNVQTGWVVCVVL